MDNNTPLKLSNFVRIATNSTKRTKNVIIVIKCITIVTKMQIWMEKSGLNAQNVKNGITPNVKQEMVMTQR